MSVDRGSRKSQSARRKSSRWALVQNAQPLLKFDDDEKPILSKEGLDLISNTPGHFYPVILMGDGRSGKSFLASRILELEDSFDSSASAEAVTDGIDCLIWPLDKLLPPENPDDATGNHVLVLDCEGGNNAMAAIHDIVNVVGAVIGTSVIFVSSMMLTEAAVENLGATIACRSMIDLGEVTSLAEQRLTFVVNKTTLAYDKQAFNKMISTEQKDEARRENRQLIARAYPESVRDFFAIPMNTAPDFEEKVEGLCGSVLKSCQKPLMMGGTPIKAKQLVELLKTIVDEVAKQEKVSLPSMQRVVVFNGFLKPLIETTFEAFRDRLPDLSEWDQNLDLKDPRPKALAEFEEGGGHVTAKELLEEAREMLTERLDAAWDKIVKLNNVLEESYVPPSKNQVEAFDVERYRSGANAGNCADRCTNQCAVQ